MAMSTEGKVAATLLGAGAVVGAVAGGIYLGKKLQGPAGTVSVTQPGQTVTVISTPPSTLSATYTQATVNLSANNTQVRTGQAVTLTASVSGGSHIGVLRVMDTTTGATKAATASSSATVNVTENAVVSRTFQATWTDTSTNAVTKSAAVTILWVNQAVGTNPGHNNSFGGSVTITGPTSATGGSNITVYGHAQNITNPVYQFWMNAPGQAWISSGSYGTASSWSTIVYEPGQWNFAVYARPASAPSNEQDSSEYEAKSGPLLVNVSGGISATLSAPADVESNGTITVSVHQSGIENPSYQFWALDPSNQWHSSGNDYTSASSWSTRATANGTWQFIAYLHGTNVNPSPLYTNTAVTVVGSSDVPGTNATAYLTNPGTVAFNSPLTLQASSSGINDPVYQFWYLQPKGSWQSSGVFASNSAYKISAAIPGTWSAIVYARPSNAPTNETAEERAIWERASSTMTFTVES